MWFFHSPEIAFGEEALSYLERLEGKRAFVVTDAVVARLGFADRVQKVLEAGGFQVAVFDRVESDPSLETVRQGAQAMAEFQPEWIVAVGGGSSIDAAKGMWIMYERPDIDPEGINPIETLHLRRKARLAAVPTTSGTGSEATWAVVLTNVAERRKLGLGSREDMPDLAIIDPAFVMDMPPALTADTGLDALTHAIEGYTCVYHSEFTDGLCLKACEMVLAYLPRSFKNGSDKEARLKMHLAATIAGLGFGNAMAALAHGMGHSLGGVFHVPHGRAVGLFLPYVIEYCVRGDPGTTRYMDIARYLQLPADSEANAAGALVAAIRRLQDELMEPRTIQACGIPEADFRRDLGLLVFNAGNDSSTTMSTRYPDDGQARRLFEYAYIGQPIDF